MNQVSAEIVILRSFKDALAAAYPDRIVTRSLKDFGERKKSELEMGIFTVVANGQPEGEDYFQKMKLLVVGQIKLPERAEGVDVEEAELQMAREVKVLIQRKLSGPDMIIRGIDQSAQLEAPYGWISLSIEVGPYDGTELLTDDENIGHLTDFLSFRADIDIEDPPRDDVEHAKWAGDPPDYSTSQPDAQMSVVIPRSET